MTADETARALKRRAQELGFAACGITGVEPPLHHRAYQRWLGSGHAGEMIYLHRQEPKRAEPSQMLDGAQSIIAVAFNYYSGPDETSSAAATGRVARYARFDDYHEIIWARLGDLSTYLQTLIPDTRSKVYCDTGPLTERDIAMRAGLGWIGKHTNLISRTLGNWFFLGEIITDAFLPRDTRHSTHCGTCARCLPACPTGAITAPYTLDARRCISYLTIELKGSIPEELRPLIGNRIYGCDDCLAVCPWNKFAVVSSDDAIRPRADLTAPDLIALLSLTDEQFRETFRHSPIRRTKRRGLLRNVCVALGNLGDARALPALRVALADHEPLIQEHAAWAIHRIETAQACK